LNLEQAETNIMDAPTKHNSLATMPLRKTKVDNLMAILCLADKKRIIVYSYNGSFQVWDWESGTQVGEEWEDEDFGVETIAALSPDGKKIASGSWNGAVKLWNVDTGKVIKTWKGHTNRVNSVSWSPDGERVVSGSRDGMFTVWDVESGKSILGPIKAAEDVLGVQVVCYSPDIDAKMIATGGNTNGLQIWNAESGELLKTFRGVFACLAWTSDGKTLIAGGLKIDTATWTKVELCKNYVNAISVSPNDRILATTPYEDDDDKQVAQLWDLETNQPIGTPLHHQEEVTSATLSVDGKFLLTCCRDDHIYTWDVSAIVKEAGLPSDIVSIDIFHF
jgi:WD40 repeat protein